MCHYRCARLSIKSAHFMQLTIKLWRCTKLVASFSQQPSKKLWCNRESLLQVVSNSKLWFGFTSQAKLMSMFLSNRLINTAGTLMLALNVVDGAGNAACNIREIAVDGIYLNRGRRQRLGRSFISPSSRMDWLIVCNKPEEYNVSLHIGFSFPKHLYLHQSGIDSFSRPTIVNLLWEMRLCVNEYLSVNVTMA